MSKQGENKSDWGVIIGIPTNSMWNQSREMDWNSNMGLSIFHHYCFASERTNFFRVRTQKLWFSKKQSENDSKNKAEILFKLVFTFVVKVSFVKLPSRAQFVSDIFPRTLCAAVRDSFPECSSRKWASDRTIKTFGSCEKSFTLTQTWASASRLRLDFWVAISEGTIGKHQSFLKRDTIWSSWIFPSFCLCRTFVTCRTQRGNREP